MRCMACAAGPTLLQACSAQHLLGTDLAAPAVLTLPGPHALARPPKHCTSEVGAPGFGWGRSLYVVFHKAAIRLPPGFHKAKRRPGLQDAVYGLFRWSDVNKCTVDNLSYQQLATLYYF